MQIPDCRYRILPAILIIGSLFACGDVAQDGDHAEKVSQVGVGSAGGGAADFSRASPPAAISSRSLSMEAAVSADASAGPPSPPSPQQVAPAGASAAERAMLIRTGEARVEVDSLQAGVAAVEGAAAALGGWVAESSVTLGDRQWHNARLVVKVPSERWGELVGGLRSIGELRQLSTATEDVGERFVDLTAQLGNAQRLEERYLQLLENRTGSLDDLLAVERELARVRGRIEVLQGRLRYLGERVATSTMVVNLEEETNLLATSPGANPLVDAFRDAWRNFLGVITGGIALLGTILPIALLLALVFGIWRWLRRHRTAGEV